MELMYVLRRISMSDPWYPLGNGNMMNILDHGIHIAQMMSPEKLKCIRSGDCEWSKDNESG
jgi:hypothetical protein